jgi:hypothetical protein
MMNSSSNKYRLIGIVSLLLIVGSIVIIMNLGGEKNGPGLFSDQGGDTSFQSFRLSGSGEVTPATDPCTLISLDQISEELGYSLEDAESGDAHNPLSERFCRISDPDNQDSDLFYLSMVFTSAIDPVLLENGFSVENWYATRKASPELVQPIKDLGNEAFWGGSGNELWNGLHILANDVYINVNVYSGTERVDLRVARTIAVTVMENLFTP